MVPLLICSDLDGTLVDDQGRFFVGAQEVLDLSAGFYLGIASARPLAGMKVVTEACPTLEFISSLQGSLILSNRNAAPRTSVSYLPQDLVRAARGIYKSSAFELWLYEKENWYVSEDDLSAQKEAGLVDIQPIVDIDRCPDDSVLKIVLVGLTELAPSDYSLLADLSGVVTRSSDPFLEIVSRSTPSAKGLPLVLSGWRSVILPTSAAIGNGINDLEMLRYADFGFTFAGTGIAGHPDLVTLAAANSGGLLQFREALGSIQDLELRDPATKQATRQRLRRKYRAKQL